MTPDEKSKLVAFARLLGVEGTPEEIIDRYQAAYDQAKTFFDSQPVEVAKVERTKRIW